MISESIHWQDALDDGSLTLHSEQLLLRLPVNVIPTMYFLFMPKLINRLSEKLNINANTNFEDYVADLFLHGKDCYQECIHTYSYEDETIEKQNKSFYTKAFQENKYDYYLI